jgi:hypothetical protein
MLDPPTLKTGSALFAIFPTVGTRLVWNPCPFVALPLGHPTVACRRTICNQIISVEMARSREQVAEVK